MFVVIRCDIVTFTENVCVVFFICPEPSVGHSGTGLICEMVLVKKLKLEASGHECRKK